MPKEFPAGKTEDSVSLYSDYLRYTFENRLEKVVHPHLDSQESVSESKPDSSYFGFLSRSSEGTTDQILSPPLGCLMCSSGYNFE